MADTNYSITGTGFRIKTQFGDYYDTGGVAIVQWTPGYEPRYRPLQEWTSTNLVQVAWVGTYSANHFGPGQSLFSSSPLLVTSSGPLYIYIDFGQTTNYQPSMAGQAWLGQITDTLTLPGGDVTIDLNTANIRPMMGELVGNTLIAQDFNSWTPQAVPEPSYAWASVALLAVAVVAKKWRLIK